MSWTRHALSSTWDTLLRLPCDVYVCDDRYMRCLMVEGVKYILKTGISNHLIKHFAKPKLHKIKSNVKMMNDDSIKCIFFSSKKWIDNKYNDEKYRIWFETVFIVYYRMLCMLHLALIQTTIVTVVLSTLTANIRLVSPSVNESISCDVMHIRIVLSYTLWLQQYPTLRCKLKSISNQKIYGNVRIMVLATNHLIAWKIELTVVGCCTLGWHNGVQTKYQMFGGLFMYENFP